MAATEVKHGDMEAQRSPREIPAEHAHEDHMPSRVLVVVAHPDDAEFTSGGSIALWAGAGADITCVVCTDGSKGGEDLRDDDDAVRALREVEQRHAATILGISEVVFLRYPDGELDAVRALQQELTILIRRFGPDRLVTWDAWRPYQLHPDHRATGLAAVDAVLAAGNPRIRPELGGGLPPHRVPEIYLFGTDNPDVWVDVSATYQRKLDAIAAHHSQTERLAGLGESMRRCNRDYGQACGCDYAETFKVLRPYCEL